MVHRTASPFFKKFRKWHEAYYFTYGASITAVNNVAQICRKHSATKEEREKNLEIIAEL
jgi:hypothetical protein